MAYQAPIQVKSLEDITTSTRLFVADAAECVADELGRFLDDNGRQEHYSEAEAFDMVRRVAQALLIAEPATGKAVDITGDSFQSAVEAHLEKLVA